MNNLFVDTETLGKPLDHELSYKNIDNWPDIRQIAWIITDKDFNVIKERNFFTIPSSFPREDDYLEPIVKPIYEILGLFLKDLEQCDVIVGHNIEYDINVIASQLYRYSLDENKLLNITHFCTMISSVSYCGFDTTIGYRYPKLQELYCKIFSKPFKGAHDAYNDITATVKCTKELFYKGVLFKQDYPLFLNETEKRQLINEYVNEGWEITIGAKRGTLKDAEKSYLSAANLGDARSMYLVASFHSGDFLSIDFDFQLAESWYQKAIEHNYLDAYNGLSRINNKRGNKNKELFYHKKYLEAKKAEADFQLLHFETLTNIELTDLISGLFYGRDYIEKDREKGFEIAQYGIRHKKINPRFYAKILQERGDNFGYFYYLTLDFEDTRTDFYNRRNKKSGSGKFYGYEDRQFCDYLTAIARCYYEGIGIKKNVKKSFDLLREGYRLYDKDSRNNLYLGKIYEFGFDDYPKNTKSALFHYEKVSSDYYPEAYFRLANIHYAAENLSTAWELILKCKKLGYTEGVDELIQKIEKRRFSYILFILIILAIFIMVMILNSFFI